MADALTQLWIPGGVPVTAFIDVPTQRGITRLQGGTGFSVETLEELLVELGVGSADGIAPLDGSGMVPLSVLYEFTGATSGLPGTEGIVPAPTAGQNLFALRGDKTWGTSLALTSVTDTSGTELITLDSAGDIDVKPQGVGDLTVDGDPVQTLIRAPVGLFAKADVAGFESRGVDAAIVLSYDSGGTPVNPALIHDLGGHYGQCSTAAISGSIAGVEFTGAPIQVQTYPTLYFVGRTAFINGRIWLAACQTDPGDAIDLVTTGNAGIGFWVDYTIHAALGRTLQFIICSGLAYSLTRTPATGINVDSSGRLDGGTGTDWRSLGVRVGDLVTINGFTIPGNNGTHRVQSITTAGPNRRLVFETALTVEGNPGVDVTVSNPGQEEIDTGVVLTANSRFAFKLEYDPSTFLWHMRQFDYVAGTWTTLASTTGLMTIDPETLLKMWWRVRGTGAVLSCAPQAMFYRRNR